MGAQRFGQAVWFGLLMLGGGLEARAQSLDDVLARYTAARGGLEHWRAVESVSAKGTFTSFSRDAPFRFEWMRTGAFLFDSAMLGGTIQLGQDANGPWWFGGVYGAATARRPSGRDAVMVTREGQLEPPLLDAVRKGHRVEFLGRGDIDGTPTLDLRLQLASGETETWHLDVSSYLEVAVDSKVFDYTQTGEEMNQRAYFSDFRTVAGIVLPFRVEKEYKSRYTVQQFAEVNVGAQLAESRFRMPIPAGMEPLRTLAGDWDVVVETRAGPRQPWQTAKTTSTITARHEGTLLEEQITYENPFTGRLEQLRLRSWDRFRQVYRFAEYDVEASYLKTFEGTLADGKLVVSNQTTGTAPEPDGQKIFERYTTHTIEPDAFKVDYELSFDGGANWFLAVKLAYARKKA